ncbi:MAG: motility-associated protein, partial [Pseudomonadota bacterium]
MLTLASGFPKPGHVQKSVVLACCRSASNFGGLCNRSLVDVLAGCWQNLQAPRKRNQSNFKRFNALEAVLTIIVGLTITLVCMLGGFMAMGGKVMVIWQPWEYVIILGASFG